MSLVIDPRLKKVNLIVIKLQFNLFFNVNFFENKKLDIPPPLTNYWYDTKETIARYK